MKWALVICLLGTAAVARAEEPKPKRIEAEGFRIDVPAGWKELPDVANNAQNAILGASTDYTASAVAHGDPSLGVMTVVFWVKSTEKVPGVRAAVEDFQHGLKESLEEAVKLGKWGLTETPTQLRATAEGDDGEVRMRMISIAAVGKDGRMTGWAAECVYGVSAKKGPALCDQVLASFAVTTADTDLKPLEKKKKK